jgi:pimeloyl-ACP methyl ester carboxylesterase
MRRPVAFPVALACACGLALSSHAIAQTDTSETRRPPAPSDRFFDSGGVRIRYVVAGAGEPVILIHGFSASADMWTELEADLTRDYRVIALDCRGHGKSGKPHDPKAYGIEMVNDVTRLMDHLGIRRAHIVGYSMGGSIALKMLIVHPERFLTAVSGGSSGFRATDVDETPGLIQNLQSGMSLSEAMIASAPPNFPKPTPAQREMMKQMDVGKDPKALAAQRLGNPGLYVTDEELAQVRVPTLILNGERDHPDTYKTAATRLPNLTFASVVGAGHGDAASTPEFARLVRQFLRDHPAESKP